MTAITRNTIPDKKNETYKYTNLSALLRGFRDPVDHPVFPRVVNHAACETTTHKNTGTYTIKSGENIILIDDITVSDTPPHWISRNINIKIQENAQCLYVRMLSSRCAITDHIHIDLGANAQLNIIHLDTGNNLSRTTMIIDAAAHSVTDISTIQILSGSSHGDITTHINHYGVSGKSSQTIRNIAGGSARAVYQGKIYVAEGAQKTDARQSCKSILLSNTAEIDAKPELEIYADDVQCSHGATVGNIDADALFYASARGIPEPVARHMLMRSFVTLYLPNLPDHIAAKIADLIDRALVEVSS
jgi:Fe-S cluster assembly protein SufD